jgi:hypothetical protein
MSTRHKYGEVSGAASNLVANMLLTEAAEAKKKEAEDFLQENNLWDDLRQVYFGCSQTMAEPQLLGQMLQNRALIKHLPDMAGVMNNCQIVINDVKEMSAKLNTIYALHSGRSGGAKDPDEYARTMQLHEEYMIWIAQWKAVISPMTTQIAAQISIASQRLDAATRAEEARVQAQASDPAHTAPIEVEFKEVPATAQ